MPQSLGLLALMVHDYDEAIRFYTEKLDFDLLEDSDLGDGKRWTRVRPSGSTGRADDRVLGRLTRRHASVELDRGIAGPNPPGVRVGAEYDRNALLDRLGEDLRPGRQKPLRPTELLRGIAEAIPVLEVVLREV